MSIRRKNLAFRYMWTAWLNLIRWGGLAALAGFLVTALLTRDTSWFLHAGIAGGVYLFALFMFLMESPSVRCLGCGGTLLRPMRCAKHTTAKRMLGSYILHGTLTLAMFARSVHCPYCGMRYRIARSTRREKHREDQETEERLRAEEAAKVQKAKEESEAKNVPYY